MPSPIYPLQVDFIPADNKVMHGLKRQCDIFYLGDGVYAAPDQWGAITLSTARHGPGGECTEHFIVLEPELQSRLMDLFLLGR